jgi:uncharacterized protein (TIGR00730 family)
MRSLCVFCGSSPGARPAYAATAQALGASLARRGVRLVYGGARVGLMRELADPVLRNGGEVTGVIPEALEAREVANRDLRDLRIVGSMHERKALMAALADGFLAIPGGAGSLEEFFEVWMWAQLGIHRKPCGLLNVHGYFNGLLAFLDHAVEERFLRIEHRTMVLVDDDQERLLERFVAYRAPDVTKWLDGRVSP